MGDAPRNALRAISSPRLSTKIGRVCYGCQLFEKNGSADDQSKCGGLPCKERRERKIGSMFRQDSRYARRDNRSGNGN